jgi:hypothetical protein
MIALTIILFANFRKLDDSFEGGFSKSVLLFLIQVEHFIRVTELRVLGDF